jgi:hypothetical protein
MFQERRKLFELDAFAGVDEKGGAAKVAFSGGVEFGKNRNQFDGKIVDAVEAHVFKGVEDGAFAGAGETGENDELASGAS